METYKEKITRFKKELTEGKGVEFVEHISYKTYGDHSQSSYVFKVTMEDGSVALVPVGSSKRYAFDGEYKELNKTDSFESIKLDLYMFKVNTMAQVKRLLRKSVVRRDKIVSLNHYFSGIHRDQVTNEYVMVTDVSSRHSVLNSHSEIRFKNLAELFCGTIQSAHYEGQPIKSFSQEVTEIVPFEEGED